VLALLQERNLQPGSGDDKALDLPFPSVAAPPWEARP
jgi:hypothetical protein